MHPERWRLFSEKPWEGKHAGRGSYKHIKKASIILGLPMPLYFVGMTGFEPATTRPPDAYSNRAELHPELFRSANIRTFALQKNEKQIFFHSSAKNRLKISRYSILTMSKYAPFGLKKFSTSILPCVIIPLWKRRPPTFRGKGIINVETGRK